MTDIQPRYSAVYRFYVCCEAGAKDGYYDKIICLRATAKGMLLALAKFYLQKCSPKGVPLHRNGRLIIYDSYADKNEYLSLARRAYKFR